MAITWPAKNNYATGDVLTATNMNGVGDDLNDLFNNNFAAGKNKIINGDFGIWQRGTSFSNPSGTYTADRFAANGPTGDTVSQQTFTPGTAPVAGYEGQYYLRYATGATAGTRYFFQKVEDVRTLAGQSCTFSFWAKVNTGTATLTTYFYQQFGSGGSADYTSSTATQTVTTSWQRFSFSITMPSVSGKTIGAGSLVQAAFSFTDVSKNLDLWGFQLEAGSTATPFQTATGTKQGELAACQRYYYRATTDVVYGTFPIMGIANATTTIISHMKLPVTMRVKPYAVEYPTIGTIRAYDGVTTTAMTALALSANSGQDVAYLDWTVASGLTQYRPYIVAANNSASAYVGVNAEL